jgi:DNA-binding NtrC family response regulator
VNLKIIIAEDEDITRKHLFFALKREGYNVVATKNGREALEQIEQEQFDVLITDIRMPEMNGIELLEKVKEKYYGIEVMVITGYGSIDSAVEAMKKGAYEYITKPFNLDELIIKVKNLHERKILKKENVAFKAFCGMDRRVSIVVRSERMQKIISITEEMKDSDCNVLIAGERGVGKGLLAKIIHFTSRRQNMPFLSMNCAAGPKELLERELFGYEKGAFPGAARAKQGLLEIADAGTLFLEEISKMPPGLQTKLFKVIKDSCFFRIGGTQPIEVNVRFIATTSKDIMGRISKGRLMEDLYYGLNVMKITVPPLRERREDIEPLSRYFLQSHLSDSSKQIEGFTRKFLDILENYSFPGNVGELENIIERAFILEEGHRITADKLLGSVRMPWIETFQPDRIKTIVELAKDYAGKVLEMAEGDKARTAKLLGISEMSLRRILKGAMNY